MPLPPSPLDAHLGYWLRVLSNEVSSAFAKRLENHAVSVAQWVVLRLLFDRKDCTLAELSDVMDMDKGALSRMIDRLVKLGMVRRECSEKSRREIALSLTKKAGSLIPVLAKEADKNDQSFFAVLTDRQRLSFLKTIKLLVASRTGKSPKPPLT
jgi:DNA-binding MarR family transcriptional regulator